MSQVFLICGPPGSGKTAYVQKHRRTGDLIIDFDSLYLAISGDTLYRKENSLFSFVESAREALIKHLCLDSRNIYNAWIIECVPKQITRNKYRRLFPNLKVIVFETGPVECLRRISNDKWRSERFELWKAIIDKWWEDYEADARDEVIVSYE